MANPVRAKSSAARANKFLMAFPFIPCRPVAVEFKIRKSSGKTRFEPVRRFVIRSSGGVLSHLGNEYKTRMILCKVASRPRNFFPSVFRILFRNDSDFISSLGRHDLMGERFGLTPARRDAGNRAEISDGTRLPPPHAAVAPDVAANSMWDSIIALSKS